jgi:hypothetical protein
MDPKLPTARLHTRGDLIAALPALLGFYPTESIVVVYIREDRIALTARQDITGIDDAAALVAPTEHTPTDAVHLAIVTASDNDLPYESTVDTVRNAFRQAGIAVLGATWTPTISTGQRWRCYDDPHLHGHLPDPATTVIAAAVTYAGQVTYPSRKAVADQLTPDPPAALHRRADLIAELRAAGGLPYGDASQMVTDAVDATAAGLPPATDHLIAELAVALNNLAVRDASMAHILDRPAAAERLWTLLVRATPGPYRAQPAVLLAVTTYLNSNTPLAILALQAALDAQPDNGFAKLLRLAIATGISPDEVRGVIVQVLHDQGHQVQSGTA